jgi:hypothetical protein
MDSSGIDYKVEYLTLQDALHDLGLAGYDGVVELVKRQKAGEEQVADLLKKYNDLVADRNAIMRTLKLLPVKLLAGLIADTQAIVGDAPRFEPLKG